MTELSRRRFLEQGLAAAATTGILFPHVAPAEDKPCRSANEKLSVAVIGVRGRGQSHVRAFTARPDCELVYICDADRTVGNKYGETLAKKLGRAPKYVEDMRRIFDDKSIDVVSIATPNHWHSLAAIWAMQAGKDVYVEKPVSHNISEGRRLVQVSRKYKRICQAGTQKRSLTSNQEAAKYVASGKLGKIVLAHCSTFRERKPIGAPGSYPVPTDVNYDLWAGPAPMAPITRHDFHYDWHWFWNYGNGEIGNNSVHAVDTMRMILGLYGLGRGVMCIGGRVQFNDAAETANTQLAIHDFDGLTVVQEIRNLKTAAPKHGVVWIVGTEGSMAVSDSTNTVFDPKGAVVTKFTDAKPIAKVTKSKGGKYRDDFGNIDDRHFGNFVKAVRSRKREEQAAEILQGHYSAALCHLGNISYRLGQPAAPAAIVDRLRAISKVEKVAKADPGARSKIDPSVVDIFENVRKHLADNKVDIEKERLRLGPWLTIDSTAEKFIGNPAADALLTRPYRKPFVVPGPDAI
jgi:predicted dehydrogenase